MSRRAELRRLAAAQHGLVARRQAYEHGLTPSSLRHLLSVGEWENVTTRVIGLVGRPDTGLQSAMAAALHHGAQAFVCGTTALALWRVPGFDLEPVHVLSRRPISRRPTAVGSVHSTTDLLDTHITSARGVPAVTPIRAIFDIAGVLHPKRVERALDNAWARRLVSGALLHRTLKELGRRGRPGVTLMRALAEDRPADFRPPESTTEARVNELLDAAGQPRLRRQVGAGDEERWLGRFDLVDEVLPLVVEVQSDLFHGSLLDQQRDRARRDAMTDAGWTFVEVWENEVWRQPRSVVARIVDARRRLRPAA